MIIRRSSSQNDKTYQQLDKETMMFQRETRFNQKFIENAKKFYCSKHNLVSNNIYEKMFSYVNEKILYEIELSKKQKGFIDEKEICPVSQYPLLYKEYSTQMLKKIKKANIKLEDPQNVEMRILKSFKISDLQKTFHDFKEKNELKCKKIKVYDFDQKMKFEINQKREKQAIDKCVENLRKKCTSQKKEDVYRHLKLNIGGESKNTHKLFSKNSYLASLNFNFSNPIV